MQIHNFYSDALLSIRTLFDKIIFRPNFIKYYSFNIANRTFELSQRDYKPNRELPAAVIMLQTDRYNFGERPANIQNLTIENINQIPVLHDPKTDRTIYIQEEHIVIPIIINVNCESQFQAKEVEFQIKRFLPLTKYIQLYSFTSFLHIDPNLLLRIDMDFTKRSITNLFTRLNKNLGRAEYCFSMFYRPLVQLTSIDTNISTSNQSNYSVNVSIELSNQCPMYIIYDVPKRTIEKINVEFASFGYEPISENPMRPLFGNLSSNKMSKMNLLIPEFEDFNLTTMTHNDKTYKSFEIKFDPEDFVIKKSMTFNFLDIHNKIQRIEPTLIDEDINTVKFLVEENFYNNHLNASITNPVVVQFVEQT